MDAFFGSFIGCSRDRKACVCLWSMNRVHFTFEATLKKTFLSFYATSQCSVHFLAVLVKLCT